jgi:hypothetical protein
MPLPKKEKNESKEQFISRCMANPTMNKEYPNNKQRYSVCVNQSKSSILEDVCEILAEQQSLGFTESIDYSNVFIPDQSDYIDIGDLEDQDQEEYVFSVYQYKDPVTEEIFNYNLKRNYKKNGRNLIYVGKAAEYQGRKVQLNKPFRTPDGPKKFSVYVKNDKGNVVKVNFGSPDMDIKRDNPARRKSFRARHNCENPGPKWRARYWSCRQWRASSPVED